MEKHLPGYPLCACHALATRRCSCGEPVCERCRFCKKCIAALNASTDESDAEQLAQWEREQEAQS